MDERDVGLPFRAEEGVLDRGGAATHDYDRPPRVSVPIAIRRMGDAAIQELDLPGNPERSATKSGGKNECACGHANGVAGVVRGPIDPPPARGNARHAGADQNRESREARIGERRGRQTFAVPTGGPKVVRNGRVNFVKLSAGAGQLLDQENVETEILEPDRGG